MLFTETPVQGAYLLEPEPIRDHRGFFARLLCRRELEGKGLEMEFVQTNVAVSDRKGTLRGLHFQSAPDDEVKIVRCTKGEVFDVIVDLRPKSPSYRHWFGASLTDDNRRMMYVPKGCATGYITLTDAAEIYYHTTAFFQPASASGVRYDDPAFGIVWPIDVVVISQQDRGWLDYARRREPLTS